MGKSFWKAILLKGRLPFWFRFMLKAILLHSWGEHFPSEALYHVSNSFFMEILKIGDSPFRKSFAWKMLAPTMKYNCLQNGFRPKRETLLNGIAFKMDLSPM